MNKKKLVIILGSMTRGGAERVASYISEYFLEKGWNVWLVLLLFDKIDYVLHKQIQVVNLSGKTQSRVKRLPYWIRGIRGLVKEIQPDVILSFTARINIITLLACMGLNKKIVLSERNDPFLDGRSKLIDLCTYLLYSKADVIIFQTKRAKSYFKNYNLSNAYVIPNPVAIQCKAKVAEKGKVVTVGRLSEQKNQKMLIEAFAEVKKKLPFAKLYIFGEGKLYDTLTALIEKLNLSGSVFLMGAVTDVHYQIADAAAFVLSSDYEGLSNALLEAMMMGLPCVSTDCAGSDEYLRNAQNGLLVKVGCKEEMANAICRILENRDEAEAFGREAEKTVSDLEKNRIMEYWYSVMTR